MSTSAQLYFSNSGYGNLSSPAISGFVLGFNTKLSCDKQECVWQDGTNYFYRNFDAIVEKVSKAHYTNIATVLNEQAAFRKYFYSNTAVNIMPECRKAAFKNPAQIHGKDSFMMEIAEDEISVEYDTETMLFSAEIAKRGFRYPNAGFLHYRIAVEICLRTSIFEGWIYSDKKEHSFFKDYDGKNIVELVNRSAVTVDGENTPLQISNRIQVSYDTGFYSRSTTTYDQEWVYFEGIRVYYHNVDNNPEELHTLRGRIESMKCETAEQCRELCEKMAYRSW